MYQQNSNVGTFYSSQPADPMNPMRTQSSQIANTQGNNFGFNNQILPNQQQNNNFNATNQLQTNTFDLFANNLVATNPANNIPQSQPTEAYRTNDKIDRFGLPIDPSYSTRPQQINPRPNEPTDMFGTRNDFGFNNQVSSNQQANNFGYTNQNQTNNFDLFSNNFFGPDSSKNFSNNQQPDTFRPRENEKFDKYGLPIVEPLKSRQNNAEIDFFATSQKYDALGRPVDLFNTPSMQMPNNNVNQASFFNQMQPQRDSFNPGYGNTFQNFPVVNQQQQNQTVKPIDAENLALTAPKFYEDKRDEIIKDFNILCYRYGYGKAMVMKGLTPIEVTSKSNLHKFKTISYLPKLKYRDSDGIVILEISHNKENFQKLSNQYTVLLLKIISIHFPPCLNVSVYFKKIKEISDLKSHLYIYVVTDDQFEYKTRILATKLYELILKTKDEFLKNGVRIVGPLAELSEEQISQYKLKVPIGIDKEVWFSAFNENPDPSRYLPSVIENFGGLTSFLRALTLEIYKKKERVSKLFAKIQDCKADFMSTDGRIKMMQARNGTFNTRVTSLMRYRQVIVMFNKPFSKSEMEIKLLLENIKRKMKEVSSVEIKIRETLEGLNKNPQQYVRSMMKTTPLEESLDEHKLSELFKHMDAQSQKLIRLIDYVKEGNKLVKDAAEYFEKQ